MTGSVRIRRAADGRHAIDMGGSVAVELFGKGSFHVWLYNGIKYASGIGKLWTEQGFPIAFALDQCATRGLVPCFTGAKDELRQGGMDDIDARSAIEDGIRDMCCSVPIEWADMLAKFRGT